MSAKLSPDSFDSSDDNLMPMAEINVTPFVDVMLVLLIVFMVTAPLMLAGVPVKLPETAAARQNPPERPLVVTLAADGGLYIRNEAVARETFISRLTELLRSEGDSIAYVRADKAIAYGEVMAVLGEVSTAGYSRISLLSERKSSR